MISDVFSSAYFKQKRKTSCPAFTKETASFSTLGSGGKGASKIIPILIASSSFHKRTNQSLSRIINHKMIKK